MIEFIKNHKTFILSTIAVLTLTAGTLLFLLTRNTNKTYIVKAEGLTSSVLINGTYQTASQVPVSSPTNGVITKLFVENGDEIKKGAKLFYVESTATQAQKASAYATYLAAQGAYQEALNTRRNTQAAVDNVHDQVKDHSGDETFSQKATRVAAETANDSAWDAVRIAEAALKSAEEAYRETQSALIISPAAGTVVNLKAKIKDQVFASTTSPVLIVTNFENPILSATVDQVNIPDFEVGQKAKIIFDAFPSKTFDGAVSYIDFAGTKALGTTNFTVYVTAENLPEEIKLNMTASITVETGKRENVLTVPNSAITANDGKNFVELANGSMKEVTLGLKGVSKTEVISGLSEGDKIIEE